MRSRRKLIERLRSLDPRAAEFYAAAAGYFWQRVRSHRNYGRFFVFLSTLSWALFFIHWGSWGLALSCLPGFVFFGLIGWVVIGGAARAAQTLHDADHDANVDSRLRRLRKIALSYRGDPISTLVLQSTDSDVHAS